MGAKKINELEKLWKARVKTFEVRVNKGIAWLDLQMPRKEWLSKINLKQLDLSHQDVCVCGQIFKDMWKPLIEENPDSEYYKDRDGFDWVNDQLLQEKELISCGFSEPSGDGDYDLLTAVWHERLSALKK